MAIGAGRPVNPNTAQGVSCVATTCRPEAGIVVEWIMEIPVPAAPG
jgi:hypothetical protein